MLTFFSSASGFVETPIAYGTPLEAIDWGTRIDAADKQITVHFAPASIEVMFDDMMFASQTWSARDVARLQSGFKVFEQYIDVTFDFVSTLNRADILIMKSDLHGFGSGFSSPPGDVTQGLTAFTQELSTPLFGSFAPGSAGYQTLLHEIGHALGLAHPFDDGGRSEILPGLRGATPTGLYDVNQGINTLMSYFKGWTLGPNGEAPSFAIGEAMTPMALDIAVLQAKYGANTTFAAGNDTYKLQTGNTLGTGLQCIWDTGGTDRIVYNGFSAAQIDLTPASLKYDARAGGGISYSIGTFDAFTIANGVAIEDAVGGMGNDTLIGNHVANTLLGRVGADVIYGWGGKDQLVGSVGDDSLVGGLGGDMLGGGDGADTLGGGAGKDVLRGGNGDDGLAGGGGNDVLNGGAGGDNLSGGDGRDWLLGHDGVDALYGGYHDDTVFGGNDRDYLYGDEGDDLLFGGRGADELDGDAGNDTLQGHAEDDFLFGDYGNDVLYGGRENDTLNGSFGDDTLFGGSGSDTFVVWPGEGHDVVADLRADDTLYLAEFGFSGIAAVVALAVDTADGVRIAFNAATSVTLLDWAVADLTTDVLWI